MKYRISLFCLILCNCIDIAFGACPVPSVDGKDGYCYKIGSNSAAHDDAIKSCDDGFHLPKVLNAATNAEVKKSADYMGSDVWLGASCDDNLNCKWDDGSDMGGGFDFWLGHNPNAINGKCVALTIADGTGRWQSVGCDADTKKGVVCQKANGDTPPITPVPVGTMSTSAPIISLSCDNAAGWKDGGDSNCYEYAAAALIFDDAVTRCNTDGGQVPKILNKLTNEEVQKLATDLKMQVWLGLKCQPDGSCKWNDGTTLNYANWIDGKPDVTEGACATMKLSGSHAGFWESADCNFDKGVICQKAATVTTSATTVPSPGYYCASGFSLEKDNRCYLPFVNNNAAKFANAEAVCKSRGAQLAIIENDEQNLIYQKVMSASGDGHLNAYLGLTYNPNTKTYSWVDGTSPNYANFSPANVASFGNCVEIFLSGQLAPKWLNTDCESVLPFACVTPASTTPVSTVLPPSGSTPATIVPPFNCNYEYFNSETVKSPNYPNPYPASIECDSLLVVDKYYVSVTFQNFSLEWGDYIDIFDGPHSGYPLLFRIQSGSAVVNQSFTTATSNKMLMRFVSAAGPTVATGFMAYFQPEIMPYTGPTLSPAQNPTTVVPWIGTPAPSNPYFCPDPNVFKSSGLIASPGYPQRFGTALNCLYHLQADTDTETISITFGPIDIDPNFDVLDLYDGNSLDSTRLARITHPTNYARSSAQFRR
uniref:C-type lectin n=1 Tax=Panagrellus redivivus TaxID=6233 RepID=A0A7E4UN54_PANRE